MSAENLNLPTPIDILEAALEKEKKAYQFYDGLLRETKVIVVQEILERLRDEENKHIHMIKKKITEMKRG